jgi:hypothetical protein
MAATLSAIPARLMKERIRCRRRFVKISRRYIVPLGSCRDACALRHDARQFVMQIRLQATQEFEIWLDNQQSIQGTVANID